MRATRLAWVPSDAEVANHRDAIWLVWQPYHSQLASEPARIRQSQSVAILWEAHSSRSVRPRF